MDTEMKVGEAMETQVITATRDTPVMEVAIKMAEHNIGSVVIVDGKKPVGIVTERDICYGVVAKNKLPKKVVAEAIMSSRLRTVNPHVTIKEAARIMAKNNIRRLPVIENKILVGIVTNKDILAIAPETIEILEEISRMRLDMQHPVSGHVETGTCEICGDYMVPIFNVDGKYLCESCRDDALGGE